jgi:hypothetical protein
MYTRRSNTHPRGHPTIHLSKSKFATFVALVACSFRHIRRLFPFGFPTGGGEYYRRFGLCQLLVARFFRLGFTGRNSLFSTAGTPSIGQPAPTTFTRIQPPVHGKPEPFKSIPTVNSKVLLEQQAVTQSSNRRSSNHRGQLATGEE